MANRLKMAEVQAIQTLVARGWSRRRIARELGIDRETVRRYARLSANPPPGSSIENPPNPPLGSDVQNQPNPPPGSCGPASACEPFRETILSALDKGLSGQRIWQDLRSDHDFRGGYDCVKRFVRRLNAATPLPFRRMECEPGAEAQVDFGMGAPVISDGRRRKTHVLRVVLSHSRKGYSEAVYRQTTEDFIRCLENAFHHFGGVPHTLVIDNLKAAVTKADWFDPELNPKIRAFCEHYKTVILPTKPATPRHKGKVERGVDYVQENALKGKQFAGLPDQNRHLLEWETQTADTRIHGTTRKQVKKCFEEVERPALLPLSAEGRFPFFHEGQRKVNRDGHVEVDKAYYSVPAEYLGHAVWARWDGRVVRIFNDRFEQIALHAQREPGRFSSEPGHIPERKRSTIEKGAAWLLKQANLIGSHSGRWSEQMLAQRGIQGVRVLQGLLSLTKQHAGDRIEQACELALSHGEYHLRAIRELIQREGSRQEQFEFIEEHSIIRSLSEYGDLVHGAFHKEKMQ